MSGQPSHSQVELRRSRNGHTFTRTYKACEACRRTKAKCERDESTQSCFKCQRERRECIFPAQRSAKRARRAQIMVPRTDDAHLYSLAKDSISLRHNEDISVPYSQLERESRHSPNLHPRSGAPSGQVRTFAQPNGNFTRSGFSSNPQGSPPIESDQGANEHDQRHRSDHLAHNQVTESSSLRDNLGDQVVQTVVASSSDAVGLLFRAADCSDSDGFESAANQDDNALAPEQSVCTSNMSPRLNIREPVASEILELWEQHRFVRQGWFTAREAIAYLQTFFTHLSPLSPVVDHSYAEHANHKRLILEEPLLCCTLLMISSRFHRPPGRGGTVRGDYIHARVWRHIEHLVQRITFGSEKYSIAKSRTLGSVQALLLITEWHPRSLHFPPENDGWDASLAPAVDDTFTPQARSTEASRRWREDVFEPAKRSDRLSWMLVGLATTLAHELGVFKSDDEDRSSEPVSVRNSKLHIRRLLYLYGTQLSLRLGCTSIFPQGATLETVHVPSLGTLTSAHYDKELLLSKWIDITKLLATVADIFFASKAATRQILRGARYINLIDHMQPLLDSWYKDYSQMSCPTAQQAARQILLVDYYYARMYIHSIAVQALVDRVSNLGSGEGIWQEHEMLRSKYAQDYASVNEVRESSGKILTIAVELSGQGILQYCPVRLFLRIVSASVFLLKAISLGCREADISASLKTLDQCIVALQTDRADDIHLSTQYASLMARHVQRFKRNFRGQKSASVYLARPLYRSRAASPIASNGAKANQNQHNLQGTQDGQLYTSGSGTSEAHNGGRRLDLEQTYTSLPNEFNFGEDETVEDWLAQPFDPQMAPFGLDFMQPGAELALDSLDFLWNIES